MHYVRHLLLLPLSALLHLVPLFEHELGLLPALKDLVLHVPEVLHDQLDAVQRHVPAVGDETLSQPITALNKTLLWM